MIVKQTSPKLEYLIKEANTHFGEASRFVKAAYDLALDEGWTPQEAKQLLLNRITSLSERTIYRYLPDESKNENFQALSKAKAGSVAKWQQKQPTNTIDKPVNLPPIEQPIIESEPEKLTTKEDIENDFKKQVESLDRFVVLPLNKNMVEFLHLLEVDDIALKIYVDQDLKYRNKLETLGDKKS